MSSQQVTTDFAPSFEKLHAASTSSKPKAYADLLQVITKDSPPVNLEDNITAWLISILGSSTFSIANVTTPTEPLTLVASRPLLNDFISAVPKLPNVGTDDKISIANTTLALIQPRVVSFEEQDSALKLALATLHEQNSDFTASANTLSTITLDSSQRQYSDTEKAQIWVRIARCHLEDDDPTAAAAYINRAKNVIHNVTDPEVRLAHSLSEARIRDSQRAFLDASAAYHRVSFEPMVDEDDRLQSLTAAIKCAVLAPAGPQRARMLARLYKDDRAAQVEEFGILEKIFLDRLLSPEEVSSFAAKLMPHQLATTADGSTVLERAILEHNLVAASRLYRNIGVKDLGVLLGVSGERAQQNAAQMIEQDRLTGIIDQIDGVIFFAGESASTTGATGQSDGGKDGSGKSKSQQKDAMSGLELRRWDANVQALAENVESVTTMIQNAYPDFYAANMVR